MIRAKLACWGFGQNNHPVNAGVPQLLLPVFRRENSEHGSWGIFLGVRQLAGQAKQVFIVG